MNNEDLIPRDKEDLDFIERLKNKSIIEIKEIIPRLLVWLQDGNWPQATPIMKYFQPHVNEIDSELVEILKGNDPSWKYHIINGLLKNSPAKLNENLIAVLRELAQNPSIADQEEEINLLSEEVLNDLE
ncbi:DUF5071 domain-containing protein [Flavobacterium silvaticum]|uniref:DUF5071 domain-containing protein n=1 Tax=Flavobacterium silvaticum TaxID=1852020 RepID=A0A972JFZ4_9FLAO|nr:DUF5071 domain-containing protein [Flavobacterium silvaticum]NMH28499.1 DUF5071 domain-containing protein [Flavobacterium silvaticum]